MEKFRLGFLLCDHAVGALADKFGDYQPMFERAFGSISDKLEWRTFDATRHVFPGPDDDCDGYMISGSRHGAYDDLPWIEPLGDALRRLVGSTKPVVGLCFGHQMLAQALGGEVAKAPQGWGIGLRAYECPAPDAWMSPPATAFTIPVCHQDQVLSLPPGAKRLASSDHCENFVVRYAPNAIGVQGHPEFDPVFVDALIEARESVLPAATYEAARASIGRRHDNELVKSWILRFLGVPGAS